MEKKIITISRQHGSGGRTGGAVAQNGDFAVHG